MRFQRESLGESSSEILKLSELHYKEVSQYQDIPLDPDQERYALIEKAGLLYLFTARTDENELVGYAAFIVGVHMHYKSSRNAYSDILYMLPKYRGHAMSFINACDELMDADGINTVCHSVTEKKDFSPVLKRLGYQILETTYSRRLS